MRGALDPRPDRILHSSDRSPSLGGIAICPPDTQQHASESPASSPFRRAAQVKLGAVTFPVSDGNAASQDQESCEVEIDGARRRIRFHDYERVYEVPGLYERLFRDELGARSPEVVCELLGEQLEAEGTDASKLRVLDLGAGNGMVGEELKRLGVGSVVGVDIIDGARDAAQRDRPEVYDDYLVADLSEPTPEEHARLARHEFNALVTVAALGFDDMPPRAFAVAHNLIPKGGWIAFNVKEEFVGDGDTTGFGAFLRRMVESGVIEPQARRLHRHRRSITGEPLHYVMVVATKLADVPLDWAEPPK